MKKLTSLLLLAVFALGACTQPSKPAEAPFTAPSGLKITELNDDSVSLQWEYVKAATVYRWEMTAVDYSRSGMVSGNHLSTDGLSPAVTYHFKIRSEDEVNGRISEWTELEFTTTGSPAPPTPPDPPTPSDPPVTHTRKAVFIGDSITRLWPETDASFFQSNGYMGKGIDGQTSKTIAARFKNDVVKNDPYVVHIMCGINDVAENDGYYVESSAILANIEKMADMAEEANIKVIIGSLTPANKFWWWADGWKPSKSGVTIVSHIVEANELIKAWCEEKGYPFIDYYTPMVGEDGGFPEPYAYDGVHPQLQGFQVMDALVQPVIEELLKDVQ